MPPPRGLVQQLDQYLHRRQLLVPRENLLIACSGGADSVALLRLIHAVNQSNHWHWQIQVAHIDHGLRGQASRKDALFVRTLAQSLQLKCLTRTLHLANAKKKISEDAARQARLRAFLQLTKKSNPTLLLAHHADDQAETVLMRIIRGTGIQGLAAIPETGTLLRPDNQPPLHYVRPLLNFTRQQLRDYLTQIHQPWREDATNTSHDFLRNRIRHELLPLLQTYQPQITASLNRLSAHAHDAAEELQSSLHRLIDHALQQGWIHLNIPAAQARITPDLPPLASRAMLGRLIQGLFHTLGASIDRLNSTHLNQALTAIESWRTGARLSFHDNITMQITREAVCFTRSKSSAKPKARLPQKSGEKKPLSQKVSITHGETAMNRRRWILLFIILIAILLRLAVIWHHLYILDDSKDYLALAQTILHHTDYQVHNLYAIRMPGYPVFLAAILAVSPHTHAILIVQSLLGGLSCGLLYLLAKRISAPVALIAAALLALDPLQLGFTAAVLSETSFTFFFLLALYLALRLTESDRIHYWALFGIVWAIAVYLRASVYWLIIPLGLWIALVHVRRARTLPNQNKNKTSDLLTPTLRNLCGLLLAFCLLNLAVLPWNLRNTHRFGPHTWLTTLEGISLYEAVYPQANGGPRQDKITTPPDLARLNEAARNQEWQHRAAQEIKSNPLRILRLAPIKIARLWSPILNAEEFSSPHTQLLLALFNIPVFLLALVGLLHPRFRHPSKNSPSARPLLGILLLALLYFTALHAVFLGSVRYRVPLTPLVNLLAAAGLALLLRPIAPQTFSNRCDPKGV